jgi:hypothetical protein
VTRQVDGDDPIAIAEPGDPALPREMRVAEAVDQDKQRPIGLALVLVVQPHAAGQIGIARGLGGVLGFQGFVGNVGAAQQQPADEAREDDQANEAAQDQQQGLQHVQRSRAVVA